METDLEHGFGARGVMDRAQDIEPRSRANTVASYKFALFCVSGAGVADLGRRSEQPSLNPRQQRS